MEEVRIPGLLIKKDINRIYAEQSSRKYVLDESIHGAHKYTATSAQFDSYF